MKGQAMNKAQYTLIAVVVAAVLYAASILVVAADLHSYTLFGLLLLLLLWAGVLVVLVWTAVVVWDEFKRLGGNRHGEGDA